MSTDARDRVYDAVVLLAALALLARLVTLGARTAHWDEGRVGYWTLRYLTTGVFEYRPVAGGPFLYIVDRHVFALLGATDFTMRLMVALIGGGLPLAALLFRDRLRGSETVALAFFLALNPVLLYYSRFARGDVVLAAAGLVCIGCLLRWRETTSSRYLYGASIAFAIALSASAFVGGYLVCWGLAAVLTFDHRRLYGEADLAREQVAAGLRRLADRHTTIARAVLLWVGVIVYFFAPRAGEAGEPGLWNLATFPTVLEAVLVGAPRKFYGVWVVSRGLGGQGHPLLPYIRFVVEILTIGALVVLLFGVVGFLLERYGRGRMRSVIGFHAYWAGASLLFIPMITEVKAPWLAVHTVVPLTVPAAVGAGALLRFGRRALAREDAASVAATVLLILAIVGQMGAVSANQVYGSPERTDQLVHYAQPGDDLDPLVADVSEAIDGNQGVDVLFYGEQFFIAGDAATQPPLYGNTAERWSNRLPLPWYLERLGADTGSAVRPEDLTRDGETPPVVIADASHRAELASQLEDYAVSEYRLRLWDRKIVVFVTK